MSHWAEIDSENKVLRVVVGDNNDPAGDEGYSWIMENLGGTWIQTSYNEKFRYNYAGAGYTYDPIDDAFIAPMPSCNHAELFLNDKKKWQCDNAEHDDELS